MPRVAVFALLALTAILMLWLLVLLLCAGLARGKTRSLMLAGLASPFWIVSTRGLWTSRAWEGLTASLWEGFLIWLAPALIGTGLAVALWPRRSEDDGQ
jgi:hypothetical protein